MGLGLGVGVERLVQVQQLLVLRAGHMPRGAEGLDVHERLWWHGTWYKYGTVSLAPTCSMHIGLHHPSARS